LLYLLLNILEGTEILNFCITNCDRLYSV
jgi:hypothetical protein